MQERTFNITLTGGWDNVGDTVPFPVRQLQFQNRDSNEVYFSNSSSGAVYSSIDPGDGEIYDTGLANEGQEFSGPLYVKGTAAEVLEGSYVT